MLVNLTESCMALEPKGCFYHKNHYPDNCKKTICNSIIVNMTTHKTARLFTWVYSKETKEIPVVDKTPCARGKLCIKGECVDHTEEIYYGKSDATAGGVRMECDSAKTCIRLDGKMVVGDYAKLLTTCNNRDCKKPAWPNNMFANEIAVRFLSCSNPMPVEMDPQCFSKNNEIFQKRRVAQADDIPFVMYEFCSNCTGAQKMNKRACYPDFASGTTMAEHFGYPCFSGTKFTTYCAGDGSCVATYKDSPDSYLQRPIMTCDK